MKPNLTEIAQSAMEKATFAIENALDIREDFDAEACPVAAPLLERITEALEDYALAVLPHRETPLCVGRVLVQARSEEFEALQARMRRAIERQAEGAR
jgi:hypothetical protein